MLRISAIESADNGTTLHLEGRLTGPWTAELGLACERVIGAGRNLTLDLGDVSMIDGSALVLLASLSRRAVMLTGCSPFHEAQLRQATAPTDEITNKAP